ncbi:hydroxylase [Streptomyces griseoviridis]|uniref:Hydroxylase n=1 Tax=Streptomyces griseoviridis TaxID=45398 RepID=A0A3Q9KRQ6_STRGD|nr:NAD(P)H-binding protein [Streptomyces griseoviridis]AZS83018.1 hydroxylase [Streptomyces griseoviridis]QCN90130.1 hydroxylase [Streptomyces griseoviridis]
MVTVVFGARGNVGRQVAAGLADLGVPTRLTSRTPDATRVAADLEVPGTLPGALEGATQVFLYAKPAGVDAFVAAARAAGVRHVVLLSSAAVVQPGADTNPIARDHRAVEQALEESGLSWTFVRPGIFATNTRWWWTRPIVAGEAVRLPYPEALTAPVGERDMAAVAVAALTDRRHAGRAYTVYGPQALSLRAQVGHLGAALGREIPIETVTPEEGRADLAATMPAVAADAVMGAWRAGAEAAPETSTVVEEITGRPGQTFAEWAREHADDFRA